MRAIRGLIFRIIGLLCTVLIAVLLYPHVEERCTEAWDKRISRITREEKAREREIHGRAEFIVGFYVGPSYSASVALFRNGTTLDLAKVVGDANYVAVMERRIARADAVKAWYDFGMELPDQRGHFGSSTAEELEQVFMPVLRTLKERSETVLQRSIEHVCFATPWIDEFQQPFYDKDDTFLVVRRRLGLKAPFVYDEGAAISTIPMPLHLNEANAVLAAAGRNLCEECFCTRGLAVIQPFFTSVNTIFSKQYSLSKKSLFLSTQPGSCVFEAYWVRRLRLDAAHGLEQLEVQDPAEYWAGVKARVLSYIVDQLHSDRLVTILFAGEATADVNLFSMAQSIRQELLALRLNTTSEQSNEYQFQHIQGSVDTVEIIVAEDGVFDAAKGATLLMRADFWGYCDGTDEQAMEDACDEHYERNGVDYVGGNSYFEPWYEDKEILKAMYAYQEKKDAEAKEAMYHLQEKEGDEGEAST
ncbi:hypothetical protein BBO_08864 [Beauveria brongniartii RCEF 3172]|uniref:Uncharacterized protein n=1 Tax=Beauveria brongniartii RCEF 3172 TaxID=1081107 RepID=A0A166WZJ3_9HYPO|nr:hypothetical protein BBO_08864 [Beauveria brongniartii RCEF 3172]